MPDPSVEIGSSVDEIQQRLLISEQMVNAIVQEDGLDFVLRICAKAAIKREAAYQAVIEFTTGERG